MDSVDRLLKTIRGVSKTNPVTNLQLSEIIRRLWSDQGKIIQIIYNEIINNTTNVYQAITEVVNEEVTNNTTNIYQSISQIIRTEKDANHESFLIENTANISETVVSSWSVLPYNQQVGEFKAVVMVRNKVTNTIVTLMSLFSFDYSDATAAVIQNDLLTDSGMTLTLGVNGSNQLYATVSGMAADAKRIHFCYERCALAEREWLIAGEMEFNLGMAAELISIVDMGVLTNDLSLTMAATLSAFANASAEMNFALGMSAAVVNNQAFAIISYGLLYNYYAAADARKITSSDDWIVPSRANYNTLITYLGGSSVAGGKLKETGLVHWQTPNTGATNESKWNGVGGGLRNRDGIFYASPEIGYGGYHYTSDIYDYYLSATSASMLNENLGLSTFRKTGISIRLIKSSTTLTNGQTGTYTGNDGKIYRTICINGVEWLADNLAETKFRNGDIIPFQGANIGYFTDVEWAALGTSGCCPPNGIWANV